jgi:hypothetical protein
MSGCANVLKDGRRRTPNLNDVQVQLEVPDPGPGPAASDFESFKLWSESPLKSSQQLVVSLTSPLGIVFAL